MDTGSLDASLAEHDEALVMFYTDTWLTCDKIRAEFDAASMDIRHEYPLFLLGSVNISMNPELDTRYHFPGYPTFLYFIDHYPIEYTGGRTQESFMTWIAAKNAYEPALISSSLELDLFGADKKVSVLLICSEEEPECA